MRQRGLHQLRRARRQRRAGRDRIGGVGRDQQRRLVAAPHRALETTRDFDAEQHGAGREQLVELFLVMRLARELEIGVFCSAFRIERPRSLFSCSRTAVGRLRGVVLMA